MRESKQLAAQWWRAQIAGDIKLHQARRQAERAGRSLPLTESELRQMQADYEPSMAAQPQAWRADAG